MLQSRPVVLGVSNYDHLFAIEAHLEAEESAAKRLLLD